MKRTISVSMIAAVLAVGAAVSIAPRTVAAQRSGDDRLPREQIVRRVGGALRALRNGVWTARVSACRQWSNCEDGTMWVSLPGRVRFEYGSGATVVSDGRTLYNYNQGELIREQSVDETELFLLLHGAVDAEVEIAAVERRDGREHGGRAETVYDVELMRGDGGGNSLTLIFSAEFQLIGWRTYDFEMQVRDLRRVENERRGLFEPSAGRRR